MLVHIDENGKILGWYDMKISQNIPDGVIEISEQDFENALKIFATHYINNSFVKKENIEKPFILDDELSAKTVKEIKRYLNNSKYSNRVMDYLSKYLRDTDWVKSYELEHKLGINIIPTDSSKWDIINKRKEYIDILNNIDSK